MVQTLNHAFQEAMSAFPAGKYVRYKRATAFFLDWLLRARGRGRHAGQRVELETLSDVVKEIAASPSTLTPKLLQELPKALAACQCSITLREHVATFFPEDDRAQRGHQYFLGLLKDWHMTLKDLGKPEAAVETESTRFENYYEVLQVDEDYFPDEETLMAELGAPKSAKTDRKWLFDEAFAEDLRLEVVYFFLELEELVEGVFTVYDQVKKQQRTMVEAAVVVKLAMEGASALTARLQLKYPALQTAEDVFNIVASSIPLNVRMQMTEEVAKFWDSFQRNGTYRFVPGMLVVDFMSVASTLSSFTTAIPKSARQTMILRDGYFGPTYGEERTPQYVLPDPSNMVVFLMQQLPHLYNTVIEKKAATGTGYDPSGFTGSFMAQMDEYFTSRKVTVPMVFTCICWLKSVAALQGNAGLSRNVSLTFTHSTKLRRNLEATYAKGAVHANDQEIHGLLKYCSDEIKRSVPSRTLARANPLLAGLMMLGHQFQYLNLGGEVIMVTSRFRAFGHLYNALVQQGYLQHIPFFDEVLKIYDQMVFTPSRAAAVHGSYNRTYLLSSHMTATAVNKLYRGAPPPAAGEGIKVRKALHMIDLSKIYRLLIENDKTVLGGASSKAMLAKAADICSKELFQTRVLSRDILKLNDDLTDAFSEMCDRLGRRQYHDDYIASPSPGESRQYRINRALEDSVMMNLMPLLDCLQSDGSLNLTALPIGNRVVQTGRLDGDGVKAMCRKTAAVIKAKFATPSLVCNHKYFTFSARPDFINQEYGTKSFKTRTERQNREDVFCELMDLLEDTDGPLSESDLNKLKSEIRKDPELLNMLSLRSMTFTDPNTFDPHNLANAPRDDLSTLFHLAAAGPVHDADLVEWMIQMGALSLQPTLHCRIEPRQSSLRCSRDDLCRTMAVHSAAISGHEDIVRIILEADNMIDLNTPTFDTKETLVHLAVKHGHRNLYRILAGFGADLRIKDRSGKSVCDMTTDRAWANDIANSTATLERSQVKTEGAKNRDAQFRHEGSLRADRLRQSVSAQRDEERRRAFANASKNTADGSKKKSTKKGKKGKKGKAKDSVPSVSTFSLAAPEANSEEVSNLLKDLLVSTHTEVDTNDNFSARITLLEDSIENIGTMFARLRDPNISSDDKVDDAQRACTAIETLEQVVEMFSHPSRLHSMDRQLRTVVAFEAQQVIHMMQKLHRVDHAGLAVPALDVVRKLCDTTFAFTKFVVGAAHLCVSVDKKTQARELLDLLEKRLVKMPYDKREPGGFRELVQTYSTARETMGMGHTSSPDTFHALEWYLIYAVDNYELQVTLDGMDGRPFYFEFTTTASARQFDDFERAIDARAELDGVACFGKRAKHVVYGGTSEEDVARVRELVLGVATATGIRFALRGSQLLTLNIHVGQFVFSSAGIVRDAAAA
ncbi:hypothetical protein PPTG_01666 [Phytophthora nicotianae INRA-310]|uniref:DUF6604 domain-containing protein n=1 Tax=Phytophthora nicotianae (strain INRA-310) TaxID=761204 RepID=W2R9X6_PHYN3|nr:hypothetical protein PPTG_01666 [Phytophthora nicotianae INRA-310]ETN21509.1 hypothetical protein PPTG_01666 [Phytophthora nicotianae INRA-310]